MADAFGLSADRQFRTSPMGSTPRASLSLPELPPSSMTVTIPVTSGAGRVVPAAYSSPRRTAGSPVPPPSATTRAPPVRGEIVGVWVKGLATPAVKASVVPGRFRPFDRGTGPGVPL